MTQQETEVKLINDYKAQRIDLKTINEYMYKQYKSLFYLLAIKRGRTLDDITLDLFEQLPIIYMSYREDKNSSFNTYLYMRIFYKLGRKETFTDTFKVSHSTLTKYSNIVKQIPKNYKRIGDHIKDWEYMGVFGRHIILSLLNENFGGPNILASEIEDDYDDKSISVFKTPDPLELTRYEQIVNLLDEYITKYESRTHSNRYRIYRYLLGIDDIFPIFWEKYKFNENINCSYVDYITQADEDDPLCVRYSKTPKQIMYVMECGRANVNLAKQKVTKQLRNDKHFIDELSCIVNLNYFSPIYYNNEL